MDISADERRRAFSVWLRTGRWLPEPEPVELKFNPWHDAENGRFTFTNSGRYFPRGGGSGGGEAAVSSDKLGGASRAGSDRSERDRAPSRSGNANPQRRVARNGWLGGGFSGGGRSNFGGGGASGSWDAAPTARPRHAGPDRPRPATAAARVPPPVLSAREPAAQSARPAAAGQMRIEVRNGYTYQIDTQERTRKVSGDLTSADTRVRSRKAQREAGGDERRPTDDGGHYIAARFNGPTEAFNHFAQDASFNRGRYRALEDQWGRAKRANKPVTVRIDPIFEGQSKRPSLIDVRFMIDGRMHSVKIPNSPKEKPRAK